MSDFVIFKAEHPRTESVDEIISQMAKGINGKKKPIFRIKERGEAIWLAINKLAKVNDTIVICGKGHEKSMSFGGVEYSWSDEKAVKYTLRGKVLPYGKSIKAARHFCLTV